MKSILRFLRKVTRLGNKLRASKQILRTHLAESFKSKIDQQWRVHHYYSWHKPTTACFPQSNYSIQGSGLSYFVNNVSFEIIRNWKRFHILIANYADKVSIQHFFYIIYSVSKSLIAWNMWHNLKFVAFHFGKYIDLMFVLCECDDEIIKKFLESVTKDTIISTCKILTSHFSIKSLSLPNEINARTNLGITCKQDILKQN